MNAKNKILAALTAVSLLLAGVATAVSAAEMPELKLVAEENFDEYADKYSPTGTLLAPYFTFEANSIGDGYIEVQENAENGNLHLKSHVFTQVYNTTPINSAYELSLDVFQTQGDQNCAIFLRTSGAGSAFYETDGSASGQSCGRAGILLHTHHNDLTVNIKTYDPTAGSTSYISSNFFKFDLPDGVQFSQGDYTNVKIQDNGEEISIFVEDTLMCRLVLSGTVAGGYADAKMEEPCVEKVTVYDAAGTQLGEVEKVLVQAKNITVGWATRVADMIVDNVSLKTAEGAPEPQETTAAATEPVTEPVTEPETTVADAETTAPDAETTVTDADATSEAETTEATTTAAPAAAAGCFGALGMGGAVALMSAAAAAVALRKKH